MHFTRRFNAVLAGVALSAGSLVGLGVAVAPSATAAPAAAKGTTCSAATAKATIKPGITLAPAKTTLTATFKASKCTRVDGITGISGKIVLKAKKLGCTSGSATGTFTAISSSKRMKSSGTMTLKATSTPLVFNLTGKVAKGFLAGSKISGKFEAKPTGGDCVTSPLTKATITNEKNTKFKL
jgi:hypothetical protein